MRGITVCEFDLLAAESAGVAGLYTVPDNVYEWLEIQCLRVSGDGDAPWLRLSQRHGCRVVQVTNYVGVLRAPSGFQVEVLPKIGRVEGETLAATRQRLIDMLCCLRGFRHIETERAKVLSARMPLLEVFVAEFLRTVGQVVKRGLRSAYTSRQDNLPALRGKLLMASHLRENLTRADRFYTQHDEFTADRPANRLLHAALKRVLTFASSQGNQQLARELVFVLSEIPVSREPWRDFQRVRLDRGMEYYADALAWARLILDATSPLTGKGRHQAPSLLFPMEAVFEAFVARYLPRQLQPPLTLKTQASSQYLVRHQKQSWLQLKPDLLVQRAGRNVLVLDTKWKMLDSRNSGAGGKYGLSQGDFYQLLAYGQNYLDGMGDLVLVYPKTERFTEPLPAFYYRKAADLRLWVVPFCLEKRHLIIPQESPTLMRMFVGA